MWYAGNRISIFNKIFRETMNQPPVLLKNCTVLFLFKADSSSRSHCLTLTVFYFIPSSRLDGDSNEALHCYGTHNPLLVGSMTPSHLLIRNIDSDSNQTEEKEYKQLDIFFFNIS